MWLSCALAIAWWNLAVWAVVLWYYLGNRDGRVTCLNCWQQEIVTILENSVQFNLIKQHQTETSHALHHCTLSGNTLVRSLVNSKKIFSLFSFLFALFSLLLYTFRFSFIRQTSLKLKTLTRSVFYDCFILYFFLKLFCVVWNSWSFSRL